MITLKTTPNTGLTERLAKRAQRGVEAHVIRRLLARRNDPRRWRFASLLWPQFRQES